MKVTKLTSDDNLTLNVIKEQVEEVLMLDEFLGLVAYNNVTLTSNDNPCPVPNHLLEKWYKDLQDHRDKVMEGLRNERE